MSLHNKLYPARPYHRRYAQPVPPLGLSGSLSNYDAGVDYEGRLSITNSIGRCTVQLVSGDLPTGYQLFVDNFTKQVVLKFPATAQEETRSGMPNGDFEQGQGGWNLPTGWAVETVPYGSNPTNKALVYRGAGSGRARSDWFPLNGLPLINFSALWNQGPSNKDNVDLYTNILFKNSAGVESRVSGSKVGGLSNSTWHASSGSSSPTTGATQVALEFEVFRRNSRDRETFVDNATWTLSYPVQLPQESYTITLRVRDSAGRTADWTGTIQQNLIPTWKWVVSKLAYFAVRESPSSATILRTGTDSGRGFFSSLRDRWLAVGNSGAILSTSDGGVSFTTIATLPLEFAPTNGTRRSMQFGSSFYIPVNNQLYALDGSGFSVRSVSTGFAGAGFIEGFVEFAGKLFVGYRADSYVGTPLYSGNGTTFAPVTLPAVGSGYSAGVSMAASDDLLVLVVGSFPNTVIMVSEDGVTFTTTGVTQPAWDTSAANVVLDYDPETEQWLLFAGPRTYRSTNGRTWDRVGDHGAGASFVDGFYLNNRALVHSSTAARVSLNFGTSWAAAPTTGGSGNILGYIAVLPES